MERSIIDPTKDRDAEWLLRKLGYRQIRPWWDKPEMTLEEIAAALEPDDAHMRARWQILLAQFAIPAQP